MTSRRPVLSAFRCWVRRRVLRCSTSSRSSRAGLALSPTRSRSSLGYVTQTRHCHFLDRAFANFCAFHNVQEPNRIIGCTGSPAESHELLWMNLTAQKNRRCPECGSGTRFEFPLSLARSPPNSVCPRLQCQRNSAAARALDLFSGFPLPCRPHVQINPVLIPLDGSQLLYCGM